MMVSAVDMARHSSTEENDVIPMANGIHQVHKCVKVTLKYFSPCCMSSCVPNKESSLLARHVPLEPIPADVSTWYAFIRKMIISRVHDFEGKVDKRITIQNSFKTCKLVTWIIM
jgi:hypothetical protein